MNRGSLSQASSLKVVADSLLWENRLKIVAGPPPKANRQNQRCALQSRRMRIADPDDLLGRDDNT